VLKEFIHKSHIFWDICQIPDGSQAFRVESTYVYHAKILRAGGSLIHPVLMLETGESIDLSALRVVTSTGSVLNADVAEWFYDAGFPPKIHLVSTSGGTDLAGSCKSSNPIVSFFGL